MKTYFCDTEFRYDGTQLRSLFAYLQFRILGDSIVSWVGPCDISFEHMMDGEDLIAQSPIRGDKMLHFILEKFDVQLFSTVALQRIMASLAIDKIKDLSPLRDLTVRLRRDGDDIFLDDQKLSISVAVASPSSTLMHFALNITNAGTPVKTLCLQDLEIEPVMFSHQLMLAMANEIDSIISATRKVKNAN